VLLFSAARLCFAGVIRRQTFPPRGDSGERRSRLDFLRANGNWRGDISHAASAVLPLGAHSSGRRCFGTVHLGDSIAGLIGYFTKVRSIPSLGLVLAAAALSAASSARIWEQAFLPSA